MVLLGISLALSGLLILLVRVPKEGHAEPVD
jgi:hypothetical protein